MDLIEPRQPEKPSGSNPQPSSPKRRGLLQRLLAEMRSSQRRLWLLCRGHIPLLAASGVAATLAMICEVAAMSLALSAIFLVTGDKAGASAGSLPLGFKPESLPLQVLLLVAFGFAVGAAAFHSAKSWISAKVCTSYEEAQRCRVFGAFIHANYERQVKEQSGMVVKVLTQSIPLGRKSLMAIADMIETTCSVLVLMGASLIVNWQLVLPAVLASGLLFFLLRPLSNLSKSLANQRKDVATRYCQLVQQGVSMTRELRVFWAGDAYNQLHTDVAKRDLGLILRMQFYASLIPSLYQSATLLLLIGASALVFALKLQGIAQLGLLAMLMLRAMGYSRSYQVSYNSIQEGLPWLDEVQSLTASFEAAALRSGNLKLKQIETLTFRNVSFEYEPGHPTLKDLNFTIQAGEIIGIIGPSGSGKSTLIQLLLRLRNPTQGSIEVNGVGIDEYTFPSWHANISYVAQDSILLEDRVDENIRFFRPEIGDEEINQAAEDAFLGREMTTWPKGFATEVGDRGARVSGGQRQRISIARALAGRPQCLILDEPTSALDVHSEAAVQETIAALKGRATVFVVAHRLSTLSICDRIMVLRDGVITGFDTPDVLSQYNEYYEEAQRMAVNV